MRGAISYESGDTSVVKVSSGGKITAKKKGTAYVYVYTQNGISETIRVSVR